MGQQIDTIVCADWTVYSERYFSRLEKHYDGLSLHSSA